MSYKKTLIISLIIFCLALILRTYNLSNIYVFTFDEEYQATYALTLVKDFHPIWIGVSASFLNFYLGPYFTYLTAILLKISSSDPLITAYFAAIVGAILSIIVFFVGRYFFNLTTGIVASFLYSTLPIFVFFDQKYWNPTFNLLVVLLMFTSINLAKKSKWWWVLFFLLVGTIFELHLATLPFALIGVWYFIKGKCWKNIRLVLVCILAFLVFYWPLIVFDINHNFSNITSLTRIGQGFSESRIAFDPQVKLISLFDSLGRFWYLTPGHPNADEINFSCNPLTVKSEFKNIDLHAKRTQALLFFSILTLVLILYFLFKSFKSKAFQIKLLGIFLTVGLVSFIIYPGSSSEYYTLSVLHLFVFVPGILISSLKNNYKILMFISLVIISLFGINTVIKASDEFSLRPKKILIKRVMEIVKDNPFLIEGRGICHNYEGWRYLFKAYGRTPSQSYTDSTLGWLYPDEISKEVPTFTVILSEDRIPLKEDLSKLESFKEGGYRAYIKKNK